MPKRVKAWYDREWLVLAVAILTFVSAPFLEDIRKAVLASVGVMSGDWFFDFLLTGGLIGLAVVLILKSDRATRACEDLRQQLQEDLADHRKQLSADLADNRQQLQEDLSALVDTKLQPISDSLATLRSYVIAFGSRLDALESRVAALKDTVERSTSTT